MCPAVDPATAWQRDGGAAAGATPAAAAAGKLHPAAAGERHAPAAVLVRKVHPDVPRQADVAIAGPAEQAAGLSARDRCQERGDDYRRHN